MDPLQTQQNNPQQKDMTAEEARASLGIATRLSEQFFNPKMAQQGQETVETEESPEPDPEALKEDILKEVKDIIKEEMSSIREDIKQALNDEEE